MKKVEAQEDVVFSEAEEERIAQELVSKVKKTSIFPEGYLEPLRGLLFVGKIEEEFEVCGHRFLMRTITDGEALRIAQLCKSFENSKAHFLAYRDMTLACAIEYVDDIPLFSSLSEGEDVIYEKYKKVKTWYPVVTEPLYEFYSTLEKTAKDVADSLKKS